MPAEPSSPIAPEIGHLLARTETFADDRSGVLAVLARIADPRKRRGVRHRLSAVVGVGGVRGARWRALVAIAEWAADADAATLAQVGAGEVVACESTFRRTLQAPGADALDDVLGGWIQERTCPPRDAVAGSRSTGRPCVDPVPAGNPVGICWPHSTMPTPVVLGQVDVEAKTNEIPLFATLLGRIDLTGAVVQPTLHAQLGALPWGEVPVGDDTRDRGHGWTERRTLKVTAVAAGLGFPHAAQAVQIIRRHRPLNAKKGKK